MRKSPTIPVEIFEDDVLTGSDESQDADYDSDGVDSDSDPHEEVTIRSHDFDENEANKRSMS